MSVGVLFAFSGFRGVHWGSRFRGSRNCKGKEGKERASDRSILRRRTSFPRRLPGTIDLPHRSPGAARGNPSPLPGERFFSNDERPRSVYFTKAKRVKRKNWKTHNSKTTRKTTRKTNETLLSFRFVWVGSPSRGTLLPPSCEFSIVSPCLWLLAQGGLRGLVLEVLVVMLMLLVILAPRNL